MKRIHTIIKDSRILVGDNSIILEAGEKIIIHSQRNNKTKICPDCGHKYLDATEYCPSCKKKVKKAKKENKIDKDFDQFVADELKEILSRDQVKLFLKDLVSVKLIETEGDYDTIEKINRAPVFRSTNEVESFLSGIAMPDMGYNKMRTEIVFKDGVLTGFRYDHGKKDPSFAEQLTWYIENNVSLSEARIKESVLREDVQKMSIFGAAESISNDIHELSMKIHRNFGEDKRPLINTITGMNKAWRDEVAFPVSKIPNAHKIESNTNLREAKEDVKDVIKSLQGDFGGENKSQMKGLQLLKFLATSDESLANKFMKALDTATTKISKEVLGEGKE